MASIILDYVETIKKRMPCGFPQLGLPPLAPLVINNQSINFDYRASMARGHIDQFVLEGLNEFDFPELRLNILASELVFRVKFDGIYLRTLYDLKMKLEEFGFVLNLEGNGPAALNVTGIEFWGKVKFAVNIVKGKIRVKSIDFQSHIDDIKTNIKGILGEGNANALLNNLLPKAIQMITNGEDNKIMQTIVELVGLPMLNEILEGLSLDDLMNMMPEAEDYDDEC